MKYLFTLVILLLKPTASFTEELLYPYRLNLQELKAEILIQPYIGSIKKGKEIVADRRVNCLSCHEAPIPEEKFQGNFGPSLIGVGNRYSKEAIRLRIINSKILNPSSIMPSYFVKIDNERTPANFLGETILTFKEVEDIVEYLYSLK